MEMFLTFMYFLLLFNKYSNKLITIIYKSIYAKFFHMHKL